MGRGRKNRTIKMRQKREQAKLKARRKRMAESRRKERAS